MDATEQQRIFDALCEEYSKHRDEIVARINLQNQMTDRALNVSFLTAGLLATLATFFLKDVVSVQPSSTICDRITDFLAVAIPLLLLHGVITQFIVAGWIYQLGMMFRITRYWNWMATEKLSLTLSRTDAVFLWDRLDDHAPWRLAVDRGILKYFQIIAVYGLAGINLVTILLAVYGNYRLSGANLVFWVGSIGGFVLGSTLLILLIVHSRVHGGTEVERMSPIEGI